MATSTIEKGDAFRDLVVSLLEAAGFAAESELRVDYKKVDARWRRDDIDGPRFYALETKNYEANLGKDECVKFAYEYGNLVDSGIIDHAWLISKGPLSPDGRAAVNAKRGLKAFTFAEFQRRLLGLDNYLRDLSGRYENDQIANWYVPLHSDDGAPLEGLVRAWIEEREALPLAIIAGYGKGKSTFAQTMAAQLAVEALDDQHKRAPILIPLGEIMDEQSLEGLLGKVFTSTSGVVNYNFALFERLNQAGRFVLFFDGFDEMKHGMTLEKFDSMIRQLLRLDKGDAKLIVLGRDTAFHDQYEFRAIIEGRQRTSGGFEVPTSDRREFRPINIRDFTIAEARDFVGGFFPSLAREANKGVRRIADDWIAGRINELTGGEFDGLLTRPVHARMLCQIATDPAVTLGSISKYGLFDRFVHFLLDREVNKRGRDKRFGIGVRRMFNSAVALWLWKRAGASTVSLSQIPFHLGQAATKHITHDYDELALRRELTQGCLVDKGSATVFFNHRSLQEFLVASAIVDMSASPDFQTKTLMECLRLLNEEVGNFLVGGSNESPTIQAALLNWFPALEGMSYPQLPVTAMRTLVGLHNSHPTLHSVPSGEPWLDWIVYFVRNGAVSYEIRTPAAATYLADLLVKARDTRPPYQAAIYTLFAATLRVDPSPQLLSLWITPEMVEEALKKVQGKGRQSLVYFHRETDFLFWLFLKSSRVEKVSGEVHLKVDVDALRDAVTSVTAVNIAEELEPSSTTVSLPVQVLYRHWKLPQSRLEKMRPFFNDPRHLARMKPLETGIRSSVNDTYVAENIPVDVAPRKTISMPPKPGRA